MKGEEMFQKNSCSILERNEIARSNSKSSTGELDSNDLSGKNVEIAVQDQIEQEPMDIKTEPLESDDEGIDDDERIHSYDSDNQKSGPSKGQTKRTEDSKVVKTIPNKCYICDTILESKCEFDEHLESHKQMLPYKCVQCSTETNPIIYTTVVFLNKHFESHGFNYICPHCPLRHRRLDSHLYHIQRNHNAEKVEYHCEICGKVFTGHSTFRNHVARHKNLMVQRYKCEICQKDFPVRYSFLRHQRLHTEQQPSCVYEKANSHKLSSKEKDFKTMGQDESNESGNAYSIVKTEPSDMEETTNHDETSNQTKDEESNVEQKDEFSNSETQSHRKGGSKVVETMPNKCYICDTVLDSKIHWDDHLDSHKNMLPYKCSQCSTETNPIHAFTVVALNKHFERHGFNYICPHCPLRYRKNNTLAYHLLNTHEERKLEFNCEICGKVYTNSQVYQRHMNAHRDLTMQRYKCEPCQRLFHSKRDLAKHKESYLCVRTTEKKSRLKMTTKESNGESTIVAAEQIIITDSQEHNYNVMDQNEVDETNSQSSIVDSLNVANSIDRTRIVGSLEKQIELQTINIINEPFGSDNEKIDDDDSSYNKNNKSNKRPPKRLRTIQHKCYICDIILEHKSYFNVHLESHKDMLPYKCPQCSTDAQPHIVSSLTYLNKHFESHGFSNVCPHCPLRHRTNYALELHIRHSHKEQAVDNHCEACGRTLASQYTLQMHKSTSLCMQCSIFTTSSSKKATEKESSPEVFLQAIKAIELGKKSARAVARRFNLGRTTLQRYRTRLLEQFDDISAIADDDLIAAIKLFPLHLPSNMAFTLDQENDLKRYITIYANHYYGLSITVLRQLAYEFARKIGANYPKEWDDSQMAGNHWYYNFMRRHPSLTIRTPDQTSLNRVKAFCRENVAKFLENFDKVISSTTFAPEDIWNEDEIGFSTVPTMIGNVICMRELRRVGQIASNARGTMVTMTLAVNAEGNSMPPFFLFPRENMEPSFMANAPIGSTGSANSSGSMTQAEFVLYMKHFIRHSGASKQRPVLLLMGNNSPNLSVQALDLAAANGVSLLSFPQHCSHKMQPLDVSVYGPIKSYYKSLCSAWLKNNADEVLGIRHIAGLVGVTLKLALSQENIKAGFIKTGIYPYNPDCFGDDDFVEAIENGENVLQAAWKKELVEDDQLRIVIDDNVPDVKVKEEIIISEVSNPVNSTPSTSRDPSASRDASSSERLSKRSRKAMEGSILTSPESIADLKPEEKKPNKTPTAPLAKRANKKSSQRSSTFGLHGENAALTS